MSLNHPFRKITGAFTVSLALAALSFAQTPPTPENAPPSPMDLDACKQVVTEYCTAWKAQDMNAMYALLSPQGMGAMAKEKFTKQMDEYKQWGCKLSAFTIKDAAPNNEEAVVTVQLTFAKEIKPSMVNGGYTVQMVKDDEGWRVKNLVAPVVEVEEYKNPAGNPGE